MNKKLVISINTNTGEFVNLNLPMDFVKRMLNNNSFDFFYYRDDAIDSEKLLDIIRDGLNYNLTGYIGEVHTNKNDIISLSIE